MENTERKVYEIYEGNMERLEKKLNRIANKCRKYGCEFHYKEVGETFKPVMDEKGKTITGRFVLVEADGIAKMNGWQFVATVEHTKNGNIISSVGGLEVPEKYYDTKAVCEHCNSDRYRKYTYIVYNAESGEFKQVGKSCLNDFTGGLSASAITQYLSLFDSLVQGEAPMQGCGYEAYFTVKEILRYAAETVRHLGYVKAGNVGVSTVSQTIEFYYADRNSLFPTTYLENVKKAMADMKFDASSEKASKMVEDALAWVAEQKAENNYMHNLQTVCSLEYTKSRNLGVLVSLFCAYDRSVKRQEKAMEKQKQDAEKYGESVHVGQVGDRIEVTVKEREVIAHWQNNFGTTVVYKFLGEDGNVFTWKTQKWLDDDNFSLVGTVKAHNEFRGIKQTELTRCKVCAS